MRFYFGFDRPPLTVSSGDGIFDQWISAMTVLAYRVRIRFVPVSIQLQAGLRSYPPRPVRQQDEASASCSTMK